MPPAPKKPREPYMENLVRISTIGSNFAFAVIGMGVIGWLIDHFAKTGYTWTLICLGIGLVGGMTQFIRQAMAATKESAEDAKQRRE